jgi:predicted DNA-binding transcriptional regulator AlpA
VHHLVGTSEIADMLGVSQQWVHKLAKRPGFPEPVARLRGGVIWERAAVQDWAEKTQRLPLDED